MNLGEINEWADFWRYEIGMNVIPANSINKKTWVSWKEDKRGNWQIEPIPQYIHDEWKKTFAFKDGLAVICGRVHHNPERKGLYLCAIDADNKKAIEVLSSKPIEEVAKETLVEAHANPNKAHYYFYTTKPIPKKSSDAVNLEMLEKIRTNEIPAIEVKGDGTHGIMYCTPSPHADGSRYQILGTKVPKILDEIEQVVKQICDQYSLGRGKDNLVPMKLLMADDTRIVEGSNRHEAIMRYAESILRKYPKMEEQVFNDMIMVKNNRMCLPPLDEKTVMIQIQCAKNFIAKQIEEEKKMRESAKHTFGSEEFWVDVRNYRNLVHPTGRFIKCVDCKGVMIDAQYNSPHLGHKVVFAVK